MSRSPNLALLSAAFFPLLFDSPAPAQLWSPLATKPSPSQAKQPKIVVRCLPPGGTSGGKPCSSAAAGSALELDADLSGATPLTVALVEVRDDGKLGRRLLAKPVAGRDGSYLFTLPRHFCSQENASRPRTPKIMFVITDGNPYPTGAQDAGSLGYFQMQC